MFTLMRCASVSAQRARPRTRDAKFAAPVRGSTACTFCAVLLVPPQRDTTKSEIAYSHWRAVEIHMLRKKPQAFFLLRRAAARLMFLLERQEEMAWRLWTSA